MNSPTQFSTVPPLPPRQGGKGCLFYGCLTAIVLVILSCGAIYFAVRSFVNSVTETQPLQFPKVEVSAEAAKATEGKYAAFQEAMRSSAPGATLTLTADEINTLLATVPQFELLGKSVRVEIPGDKLAAKMSLDLTPYGFSGRFVNGEGILKVKLQSGTLVVNIDNLIVNGKALPEDALAQIRGQNIAEEIVKKPEVKSWVDRFASIEVVNNTVVIKLK